MYLRRSTVRKNGKTHTYWRLVRSVRIGGKVRQETVACLGELDAKGRAKARALAKAICGRPRQRGLFDEAPLNETVTVRVGEIRLQRGRRFGDVWLAWTLWRALQFDALLEALVPPGREAVRFSSMAAVLVLARMCEPSSELHIAEDWFRQTALDDLLGLPEETVNDDRLYRALDRLLPQKEALERHLRARLGELFDVDYDLLLYDVTSTYFEGLAKSNPLAQYGYSRDRRSDCKQVCIGLVVTSEGLPLSYEVFAGNRADVTTVEEIVEAVEGKYGRAERIWVMDRGMVSEETLAFLRKGGRQYVLGTPRSELKRFERVLTEGSWTVIRDGLEVQLCAGPHGQETFILCRSTDRREKEQAMHERFGKRIEEGLVRLQRRLARARKPADASQVNRQIGRLLERNRRAVGLFAVRVEAAPDRAGGLRVRWRRRSAWARWAALTEGCYLLRSNIPDWSAEDLWRTYIQLTQAEAAFRIQKSDLRIRPIWHQRADRVQAHILVCFLAYVLWKTLEQWQSRAGLGNSPGHLLDELRRLQSTDVVLPTTDGRELRLRCVVRPDKAQAALLDRLGLRVPKRLRPPRVLATM
ncbi:MAG: IS1634 family transposase [Planctomycetota bacterium]|jgi:transposase